MGGYFHDKYQPFLRDFGSKKSSPMSGTALPLKKNLTRHARLQREAMPPPGIFGLTPPW